MTLRTLDVICYAVCVVCIVCGVVLGLLLIWGGVGGETAWRGLGTAGVLLAGASLMLAVNRTLHRGGDR